MEVSFEIPHDLAIQATAAGDISRRALEEFRAGNITQPELRRALGLARLQMDGFLKAHGIYEDVTHEDIERDVADLRACLGA